MMRVRRWTGTGGTLSKQWCERHRVRPIVAIVPANEDPSLVRCQTDPGFWQRARAWENDGWMIAMHGYSHSLRPSLGGMVPVNRRSEFVGLPWDEQRRRIHEGGRLLAAQGITPQAWVAPAHGFDRVTLEALKEESPIRVISDSFARRSVGREGFVWIPQQLWHPRHMRNGLWTICLHPNDMDNSGISMLDAFITAHRESFSDPKSVISHAVPFGLEDAVFEVAFLALLRIRKALIKRHGR